MEGKGIVIPFAIHLFFIIYTLILSLPPTLLFRMLS